MLMYYIFVMVHPAIYAIGAVALVGGAADLSDNGNLDGSIFDMSETSEDKKMSSSTETLIDSLTVTGIVNVVDEDFDSAKGYSDFRIEIDKDLLTNATADLTIDMSYFADYPVGASIEDGLAIISVIEQPMNSDVKWTDENDKTRTIIYSGDVTIDGSTSDKKVTLQGVTAQNSIVVIPLNPDSRDLNIFEKFEDSDDEVVINLDFGQKNKVQIVLVD